MLLLFYAYFRATEYGVFGYGKGLFADLTVISLCPVLCLPVFDQRMPYGAFLLFRFFGLPLPGRFRMSHVSAGCPSEMKSPCSAACRLETMPSPENHKNRFLKYPLAFLPCHTSFWNDRWGSSGIAVN